MLQFILAGGPWSVLVLLVGLSGLVVDGVLLSGKSSRNLWGLAIGLSVAAVLIGVTATCVGLHEAGPVIVKAAAADQVGMLARVIGLAVTPTALGTLLAGVGALLCGVAHARSGACVNASAV